jgi:L-ascorbate metabolism protein UlaG (beta-lactamase superfamily)
MENFNFSGVSLEWLGHAGFRIKKGVVVYIDPYQADGEPADIILITHEHFDHLDKASIGRISRQGTKIFMAPGCRGKLDGTVLEPGHSIDFRGVKVTAVPAYNIGKPFHKKGECIGFVIEIGGVRIYHAGDTDKIPEMGNLRNIDIALLPVGGTYTMNASEAAEAAKLIKPKMAIPMHYGKIVGSEEDSSVFESLAGCKVKILG